MILTVYACLMLLMWVGVSAMLIINTRKITYLKNVPATTQADAPSIAVIIAVKDEEADIEEALHSVMQLQYPQLRVIVVNDRSTDHTPEILSRISKQYPALTVMHIDHLPGGWLGKNHALYKGYMAAAEDWLLFTDADVKFKPEALQKAMHYIHQNRLDHLTVLPEVTSRSTSFKAVMNTFALMLDIKLRPWTISDPSSKSSLGVGAFNLVRRDAYVKAGTHTVISLRPDDDLKLGERIKQNGGKQDVVYGETEIWLEWYTSLGQFINGLMKNMYSIYNYEFGKAMATAVVTFLILVLPVPLLLLSGQPYAWVGIAILAAQIAIMIWKKVSGQNGGMLC